MVVLNVMHVSIHKPECARSTFSMNVGRRLLRCGVDVLPLSTFAAHDIFLAADLLV